MKLVRCLVVGKKVLKRKLPWLRRRNVEFRDHEAVLVLGIPDIVVRERIDVDVQPTIVVEVHVGHEIVQ